MRARAIAIIGNQGFSIINFRGPLIADLVARGHRVFALAPDFSPGTAEAVRALGAEPIHIFMSRTGMNPLADLATFGSLHRALRRARPDVILACATKPAIYGTLAGWLAGVPVRHAMIEGLGYVFATEDEEKLARRALRVMVKRLLRLALGRARKVLFLNPDDVADFVRMRLVAPGQPVNIGAIGVDLEAWHPVAPAVDPVTFILVARLLRDKGISEFVAAARSVKAECPRARFVLLGGLDENPSAIPRADVEAWVREGVVEWPGHVSVAPWLARASVFVLPSYREGVPRSTQEAMAMGLPVITTDAPGCRETVVNGVNGYLVPVRDSAALADAMRTFIARPETIAAMGAESRRLAEERFDVHRANAGIIEAMGL